MKSQEYWQKRFTAIEAQNNKTARSTVHSVTTAFDKAQAQIEKELNAWYARFADNNQITLQEAKSLLNTRELKEFRWDVEKYIEMGQQNALDQKWLKELENASARVHVSRLEALRIRTQQAAEMAFGNELDALDQMAARMYTDDYYHTAYEIQRGLGIGWDIGQVDQRRLKNVLSKPWTADKLTFSDRIWKSKTQLLDSLQTEFTQMCILGKAPDETIKLISHKMNVSKGQAGRLIMTEAAYFSSAAQKDCFNDLDVEKFEVVATLDSHTSETCQHMDGQVFDMKDFQIGVTAPPFHVWCRSCTAPWFEDNNDGERIARDADGKTYMVPADMKYQDWKQTFVNGGSKKDLKPATVEDVLSAFKNNPYFIEENSLPPAIYEYRDYDDFVNAVAEWRKTHNGSPYDYFCENSTWATSDMTAEQIDRIKRFDATIAKLQSDYPLNPASAKQLYIGTYENMGGHLTDIQRSRMDESGLAQAQFWFNPDDNIAVIGFRHSGVRGNLADDLLIREQKIKNGEVLSTVFDNSPEGFAIHEWGHGFTEFITDEMIYDNPAAHEYWKWYKTLSEDDIMKGVSSYAATNRHEFEAECFAEILTGNPRPIAKKFGEYLDRCQKDALKRLEKYGADAIKSGTAGVIEYSQSLAIAHDTSAIKTVILPKKEYAHVMSEIATNLTEREKNQFIVTKAIGKYQYTFENHGFGEYRIIKKTSLVDEENDLFDSLWGE